MNWESRGWREILRAQLRTIVRASRAPECRKRSDFYPLPSIRAEQVQLVPDGNRPDALADVGADGAGDADDHFTRRQLAGIGGNLLRHVLPRAVNEGFG